MAKIHKGNGERYGRIRIEMENDEDGYELMRMSVGDNSVAGKCI